MTTVTLWLLVSLPINSSGHYATPTSIVERFTSAAECNRVAEIMRLSSTVPKLQCIQATIVK